MNKRITYVTVVVEVTFFTNNLFPNNQQINNTNNNKIKYTFASYTQCYSKHVLLIINNDDYPIEVHCKLHWLISYHQ